MSLKLATPRAHWAARLFRCCFRRWHPRGYMRLGEWMTHLFPASRYVPITFLDDPLWVDLRSIDHQPVFLAGDYIYEPVERQVLAGLLQPGQVALDVGANLGAFTRVMARAVGESGLVVAYEPKPELAEMNCRQFRQVVIRPFGASAKDDFAVLRTERAGTQNHIVAEATPSPTDKVIVTVSLDADCRRLNISRLDLIKVDVEGYEEFVFLGAASLLAGTQPPVLMFEWNPNFRARGKEGALAVLGRLVGPGWSVFHVHADGTVEDAPNWRESEHMVTVVAIPPQRPDAITRLKKMDLRSKYATVQGETTNETDLKTTSAR